MVYTCALTVQMTGEPVKVVQRGDEGCIELIQSPCVAMFDSFVAEIYFGEKLLKVLLEGFGAVHLSCIQESKGTFRIDVPALIVLAHHRPGSHFERTKDGIGLLPLPCLC